MMKFFRKYTKHLLAIFMALLLIVWLGGTALEQVISTAGGGKEPQGRLFGKEVLYRDLIPTQVHLNTLQQLEVAYLLQPWVRVLSQQLRAYDMRIFSVREDELSLLEWHMLVSEALKNGAFVPEAEIHQAVVEMSRTPGFDRVRQNLALRDIESALHSYHLVTQQAAEQCEAIQVAESDIRAFVRETQERAKISVLQVNVSPFMDRKYEPTGEELVEQFEKYKDEPRPMSAGLKFGYQKPEAVRIECIRVNVDPLVDQQRISAADKRANEYWQSHKEEFTRPVEPQAEGDPRRPSRGEPYATYTEAQSDVVAKLKRDGAVSQARSIASDLIRRLESDWESAATTQPGGFKVPPESARSLDLYASIVASSSQPEGVLEHLTFGDGDEVMEKTLLSSRPMGLSNVYARVGQNMVRLVDAAFMVAGLEEDAEEEEPVRRQLKRNIYQTCPIAFTDDDGNAYVMRTVAARPPQAPESYEEVRSLVASHVRRIRAFEEAGRLARELADAARREGLEAAFKSDEALHKKLSDSALKFPAPFARSSLMTRQGAVPMLMPSRVADLVNTGWDPDGDPEVYERIFDETDEAEGAHRILVHEQPDTFRWLVIEVHKIVPPTQEEYDGLRDAAYAYYRAERCIEAVQVWFDADQIRARVQWVDAPKKKSEETTEGVANSEGEESADNAES